MNDFGRELEACLNEVRAGGGASETMVLMGPRLRRKRRLPIAPLLVALGLVVAVAVLVAVLTHDGSTNTPALAASAHLQAVTAYDPPPGDGHEDNGHLSLATDGNPATAWSTEAYRYPNGGLGKPGVGIVVDAGRDVRLSHLTVTTDTPGFTAKIEAGNSPSGLFRDVSGEQTVVGQTTFNLQNASARYYVVWITNLGSSNHADVNEVAAS
jgi:eukaryotic-like serine/threonine-protein kinase